MEIRKTIDAKFQIQMYADGSGHLDTTGHPDACSKCVVTYKELTSKVLYKLEITVAPCPDHRGKDNG